MSGSAVDTLAPPPPDEDDRRPARSRFAFLASRGWLAAIVGALIGSALCFFVLAPWQFNRNAQRTAENARIIATATAEPVALDSVLPVGTTATDQLAFRPVVATGSFEAGAQVAVGLRQNQAGQASLEILTPFRLSDGSVLLVDRGYVSANTYSGSVPLPAPPSGTVTITARVQPFQPDPLQRRPIQRDGYLEVRGIQANSVPGLTGVRDGFVQLTENSPGVIAAVGVPQVDSGPFLSYAWQWITFGTMALLAVGFFIYREVVDPRDDTTDEETSPHAADGSDPCAALPRDGSGDDSPAPQRPAAPGRAVRPRKFDRSQLYDS